MSVSRLPAEATPAEKWQLCQAGNLLGAVFSGADSSIPVPAVREDRIVPIWMAGTVLPI
jgi:hypothetical protein